MKREQMPAHRVSQCTLAVYYAEMFVQQFMHSDGAVKFLNVETSHSLAVCHPCITMTQHTHQVRAIRISFVTQRIPVMNMRLIKIL